MSVDSKFAPTYGMVLALLKSRSLERAEELLERSFGQHQAISRSQHWVLRRANLEELRHDLRQRVFRHPRHPCTEATLTRHLTLAAQVEELESRAAPGTAASTGGTAGRGASEGAPPTRAAGWSRCAEP